MIVSWPAKIKAGTKTDHISAFWDVMPTFAEIAEIETPKNIDGISFLPSLTGQTEQKEHQSLYWEFHEMQGRQAVRKGDWKLVRYNVLTPEKITTELYNLKTDVGEKNNLAGEHPDLVKEMIKLLNQSRVPSEAFPFPLKP